EGSGAHSGARALARDRSALHELVHRGTEMTAWAAREHHRFEAAGKPFVYLVPSAAIFELDEAADSLLRALSERPHTREELGGLENVDDTLAELTRVQAIALIGDGPGTERGRTGDGPGSVPRSKVIPLTPFPLTTMVLNVTNQCNLSCTYCYEYG